MMGLSLYSTEGIILRVRPFGEADRILTILTRTEGVEQSPGGQDAPKPAGGAKVPLLRFRPTAENAR